MWKKSETAAPAPTPTSVAVPKSRPESPRPETRSSTKARIGTGIFLQGELRGEEDIVIEGRIEGKITVEKHGVIIGESGRVDADVFAANISIAGHVKGNVRGTDKVVLLESARVEGNITAKSITIETGAQFKGNIDMETVGSPHTKSFPQPVAAAASGTTTTPAGKPNGPTRDLSAG